MEFKIKPLHNTTEHSTTRHGEGQLTRIIDDSKDAPHMPAMGGHDLSDPLKTAAEQVACVVASEVLTPLLDKINIFIQLAGKFAEVQSLEFATKYV